MGGRTRDVVRNFHVLIGTPSVYEDYIWRKLKSAHAALLSCEHSTRTPSEPFGNKKLLL